MSAVLEYRKLSECFYNSGNRDAEMIMMAADSAIAVLEEKISEQLNLSAEQYDHGVRDGHRLAEAALAERDGTIGRLQAVIGSVSEHDRVFGGHIAAAMKKYDLRAHAEEAS